MGEQFRVYLTNHTEKHDCQEKDHLKVLEITMQVLKCVLATQTDESFSYFATPIATRGLGAGR